jgi:hypothetical protein
MPIRSNTTAEAEQSFHGDPDPQVIDRTPDHLIVSWRHILLVVWRQHTTLGAVHTMGLALGELASHVGRPGDLLIVAEETAAAPDAEVRGPIAQVLRTAPLARCAMVLEGYGFRAAALRAFATGVGLLARPPFPYRPFAHVGEAAKWLAACEVNRARPLQAHAIEYAVRCARGQ